jgi:hypothetical protein
MGDWIKLFDLACPRLKPNSVTKRLLSTGDTARKRRRGAERDRMFILRSAFWLTAAFILVQPSGATLSRSDIEGAAQQLATRSIAAGQSAAKSTLAYIECASLECAGTKLILGSVLADTSDASSLQSRLNVEHLAPYPHPRLVR